MTGLETSEMLCEAGNRVSVIEMAEEIAPGAWFQQLDDVLPKLEKYNTEFLLSSKLIDIQEKYIVVENTKTKKQEKIYCDLVVLSLGVRSDNALYEEIKDLFKSVYNIGDSAEVGRIYSATESAYRIVKSID